jgi:aspartate aminotransferase
MNVMLCLLNPGDEVLIPAPYWVSYYEMVQLAGGVPVVLPTTIATDYKATPQQVQAAINDRTRGFLFSSPSNPTGEVYSQAELQALAHIFAQYPAITIISDEIYEYINFVGAHHSIAQCPEVAGQTVVVNGFSKGFAMTGWRLGYIAAPLPMAKACAKMQGQFTSGTVSITQRAGIAALTGSLAPTYAMRDAFERRRDIVYNGLKNIQGVLPNYPKGAFYIFPDVSYYFNKKFNQYHIKNTDDLAMYVLAEAFVAVVTGAAFGNENCIRISFAAADADLHKAMAQMKTALEKLQ